MLKAVNDKSGGEYYLDLIKKAIDSKHRMQETMKLTVKQLKNLISEEVKKAKALNEMHLETLGVVEDVDNEINALCRALSRAINRATNDGAASYVESIDNELHDEIASFLEDVVDRYLKAELNPAPMEFPE